jgi:uncharacterized protein YodC (DUF2158 family)
MHDFKEGDTVRLKSGGPFMTIDHIGTASRPDNASCVWFDGTKKERGIFPLSGLEHTSPAKGIA